jgi:hypothetical protein
MVVWGRISTKQDFCYLEGENYLLTAVGYIQYNGNILGILDILNSDLTDTLLKALWVSESIGGVVYSKISVIENIRIPNEVIKNNVRFNIYDIISYYGLTDEEVQYLSKE